jgi:hypothetical protein
MSSHLEHLTARVVELLTQAPLFAAAGDRPALVPIVEQKGDIGTAIATALEKFGLAVVVIVSDCAIHRDGLHPGVCEARLLVEVAELPLANTSGRRCLEVAEVVAAAVDRQPTGLRGAGVAPVFLLEPGPNLRLVPHPSQVIRHVAVVAQFALPAAR